MSLYAHTMFPLDGSMELGVVRAFAYIDTTTSGTIDTAATASRSKCGITVVKTATKTGRYTMTFDGAFKRLLAWGAGVEGAADTAYTVSKGIVPQLRGVSPSTGVLYLQFCRSDSMADAEVQDAANIWAWFDIQLSSARG